MSLYTLSVIEIDDQPTPVIYTGGQYYAIAEHLPDLLTDSGTGLLPIVSNWSASHAALEELARKLSSAGHGARGQSAHRRILPAHLLPTENDVCRLQL
jgi:hypothetical protein